jgi:hypothetical protein
MRNRGIQAMLFPCIDCLNQKKFGQREIIFYHLVTCGFTKNYTCWNKHGEEDFNELEEGCLNEGEVRHHSTGHDEDLDEDGVFEENEPFLPNVMRLRISLINKLGASIMVRCCNVRTMLIKCCGMLSFNECTHLLN